ncbi:unnamed protein product (macronuclear) [Paramecium tetraurelia]|uniref:Uncharacterized protein n=1 Tax=Paramecium tetraurelia TaxID=5888 RepID=A0DGX7_PARTE|nr:uncharacterized protein GSPATT00002423001 [Paramecium tetraurelia]CAK82294.1 unnamed protein product [Paramecium tetraurelia]|eukprot:XP_001449691.1 hypothetical protein (macronuclear) [Paramecium tetraurelia strain d4-2]
MLTHQMFCNYFPLDSIACVSKTQGIKCYYNQFESSCMDTSSTSHGCLPTLNQLACLNQLTNQIGEEARCIFGKRCVSIKPTHLAKLGCYERFSKYSCTNVANKDCIWNGNKCTEYLSNVPDGDQCEAIFGNSVTPSMCQKIQNLKCMNGGFSQDYKCVSVNEQGLAKLKCTGLGINQDTCISITTSNQQCIFIQNKCQEIKSVNINKCEMNFNRLGCLGIYNPKLLCQWKSGKCQSFVKTIDLKCENVKEVNQSVCQQFEGKCKFDTQNFVCKVPAIADKLTCNTQGLTKELCLSLKNQYCTFTNGKCESITLEDLKQFQCEMSLNEDACVNVLTQYQYCKWDGQSCIRQIINQDLDCELNKSDTTTKYNGNVCQAISKPNVSCKYNASTHRCVNSDVNDLCESPYINLFGCVSITKPGIPCQWTLNGCIQIEIKSLETTCNSLQFANPNACSQVYENSSIGCYFNQATSKCDSIDTSSSIGQNLLNTLECQNKKIGLNRIACASITTQGQICRWNQSQCQQIRKKVDVAQVECLKMQFVNPQACALVEYGKEPCRYLEVEKSCVNSVISSMTCNTAGLNTYACAQVSGSCYFDTELNQCKELDSANPDSAAQVTELLQNMQCQSSSPTRDVCTQIITIGQLCQWSERQSRCLDQSVLLNQKCSNYSTDVKVNANVCAAIEMEFPDYDFRIGINSDVDRGYCKFMPESGTCQKNTDLCTTPCCTEKIGINAHSCSRYSSQAVGVYCFFGSNLRCQQLTSDIVDISKPDVVKNYYNSNQMRCSQMNRNSCHMIEWSTKQLCYYNGKSCVNINYSNYGNLDVFIQFPAILNKYGCLAIEATITNRNTLKYFLYDDINKRCKPNIQTNYATCNAAGGNSNVCLRFTPNVLCKWNPILLTCQEITSDEYDEIYTCSYNQNYKACIENPNTACQFSFTTDKCIDAPTDVDCDYFNSNGPVGSTACERITKDGQLCEYNSSTQTCKYTNMSSNKCSVPGANSITCYKNTGGLCRWDPQAYECYENQTEISLLGCEDYINQNLCILVTKEPCYWDNTKFKCLKLTLTDKQFVSSNNLYNRLGCYSITGGAFYHDSDYTCVSLSAKNKDCQAYYLNEYACLFHTQGHNCYFDYNQSPSSHKCKPFNSDQTKCSSAIAISVEVCMQIPSSCYFNLNTLKCVDVEITETQTCTNLKSQQTIGYYYNKIACVSISQYLDQTDGNKQCLGATNNVQQCNFEKYCFWETATKTCEILQPTYNYIFYSNYSYNCQDANGNSSTCTRSLCVEQDLISSKPICLDTYSRALCLEMVSEQCYFDINQGGCLSLSNNQHKLPDCSSIVQTCNVSSTPGVICELTSADPDQQPGKQCKSLVRSIRKCINNGTVQLGLTCNDYKDESSPIICASATDACRSNNKCISSQPSIGQGDVLSDKCDKSMSKTMCEAMGCNFTKLNYCQKTDSVPQKTSANKYYLCYEVNKLQLANRDAICSQVDQSCIYSSKCEDATGFTCAQLISNKVSKKACISCSGSKVKYDPVTYRCSVVTTETFTSCDGNLNQSACLINTPNLLCKWDSNQCTLISNLSDETSKDCSIYNQYTCPQLTAANCYVNISTSLCSPFNPLLSKCADIKLKQLCIQSNFERCKWDNTKTDNQCVGVTSETDYTDCSIANQYGCLNMVSKQCGWSSENNACYSFNKESNFNQCNDFVLIDSSNQDRNLVTFNSLVCSKLAIDKACIRDEQYRCREAVSADILKCNSPGLNKYACVNRAVGKCKYDTTSSSCVEDLTTTIGCSDQLNVEACINQDAICKFVSNTCQTYDISTYQTVKDSDKFPYSMKVCSYFDNKITTSIVYSFEKMRCVKATNREPFITNCSQLGINKFACLNKTTANCQYNQTNKQCLSVTREMLTNANTCDPTFNWAACIQINAKCQFKDNQCQAVPDTTLCQDLQDASITTNQVVCLTRQNATDKACKWNTQTKVCNVVDGSTEVCSQPGLNKKGCIFNTLGSMCIYLDGQCTDNYENVNCTSLVNKDKCYSIRTKGQYCKFDPDLGCIDTPQTTLAVCLNTFKTNPLSCSLSTDIPCFYDNTNNVCKKFEYPIDSKYSLFYSWSNRLSFNKQACLMYVENNLAVYWMDECLEIPTSEFSSLTCNKPVNKWGCLKITNPLSNCQFNLVTSTCEEADLSTFVTKSCSQIVNVNNGRFCEINNTAKSCQYDNANRACIEVTTAITECENKGYNKIACNPDTTPCQFYNNKCFTKSATGKLFCSDAASNLEDCKNVQKEGCDTSCKPIPDYSTINCENAINSYGCAKIVKSQQYCIFTNQKCTFTNPKTLQSTICKNITNINNPIFCEQSGDVGCYYDQDSHSCKTTNNKSVFGCVRGINQIACLASTTSTLQCKFLDYCYGPNSAFLSCDVTANLDPNACCQNASTIESCLFQDKLKCSWNPNTSACVPYVAEELECGMIQFKSKQVCLSKVGTFCVFNTELKKCEQIQPVSCNQAQSYQQCQSIDMIPCIWDNLYQICKYKVKENQDECEDIKQGYGNRLACLSVERLGQTCQFIGGQCETYNESKTDNNCLSNINKVACTQQQSSKCYWKYSVIKIKKTSWSQETDLQIGECNVFTDFNTSSCEEYLSYLSCLSVSTTGKQCRWQSGKCQQIEFSKSSIFSPKDLILVNSNACSLINNGDIVQYNPKSYTCKLVSDLQSITCQPLSDGINKLACLKIKSQSCLWDDVSLKCVFKNTRLLVEEQIQQNRLLQSSFTCKRDGIGPKLCKQLNFELPCGSVDDGCDLINLNTATCEDPGLNKYACLNLTTGPCAWVKDDDSEYYHCEEFYPYTTCVDIEYSINSLACTYVEDDPCVYNKVKKNCETPTVQYNVCEVEGINAIACSSIKGCLFKDQKCITWDPNYNLLCNQAEKANQSICQLAIDRCKYSELTFGCVASTITDNCYTNGLSALGCNVLDECSWSSNSCQCISYQTKFPDCSSIGEYTKCANIDYCYFEVSQSRSSKDITQYLKNTNYGTCRNKTCADVEVNKCNSTTIDQTVCYLNSKAKCLAANKCEDISDASLSCLQYEVNNQSCRSKSNNTCQTLDCNQIMDKSECELYTNECVFAGYCKKISCEYMGKSQCLVNKCDWNSTLETCQIQLDCSQITVVDTCIGKRQGDYQCAWLTTIGGQKQCTSTGCRYLGSQQGDCMGTHIGTDVCVQMIDFSCVACQEIKDACICLNQSQFCTYDKISQKCSSKSCQHHNKDDCPVTHCKFNSNTKICQPLCQYNYNQQQCNQDDQCLWNTTNQICVAYIKPVVIEQINLPSPDSNRILDIIILILIMIY